MPNQDDASNGKSQSRLLPNPDPTVLTTQQLLREIENAKAITDREVAAAKATLEARLNGMDKAITLIQAAVDRSPTIAEIFAKFTEKFLSIETQFRERDTRTEQTSRDSKVAVDAALQAAKEAVGEQNKSNGLAIAKSEASTTKQIDGILTLIATTTKAQDDKITDLKDRLQLAENRATGMMQHSKGLADGWGYIVGALGLLIGIWAIVSKFKP